MIHLVGFTEPNLKTVFIFSDFITVKDKCKPRTDKIKNFVGFHKSERKDRQFCRLFAEDVLYQRLVVDNQLKGKPDGLRCFAAHDHTVHENFKVIHDGTVLRVNGQSQGDKLVVGADFQRRFFHRIVDPVVNIKGCLVAVSDSASPYVRFVRKYQCGGNGIDGNARTLVMIPDGGNDIGYVLGRHSHIA